MTQTVETTNLDGLAQQIIAGRELTEDEALTLLKTSDAQTLELLNEASILRRKHFGMSVKVNYLVNLKSGLCPEDCNYCSQRLGSAAEILKYKWLKTDEVISQAEMGIGGGAQRVCLVASGRGPTHRDVERVADMITGIKDQHPEVEICACLGILKDGQAQRLREAGADAYNHNINTAASHYESICSTHTYEDRVETVAQAQNAGMSACSGLIVGMGESEEQLVEALFALKAMGSDSVPVNFLMPFDGTPLEGTWELEPLRSLRILAVARMVMPDKEVRMAGGREMHLRSLQGMALHVANSLFLGDYLTSEGQAAQEDLDLIRDNGFHVLGEEAALAPASESSGHSEAASCCGSAAGGCSQEPQEELVGAESAAPQASPVLRRRGAGTGQSPNA